MEMIHNLHSIKTAPDIWEYFKRIYNQGNTAKSFQLELEISNWKQHNLSI